MKTPLHQRLYLRIWLAVLGTVVLVAVAASWLARIELENDRAQRANRVIVLRNAAGEILGQAPARPTRIPGGGPEFQVTMANGETLFVQLPRPPREGGPPRDGPGRDGRPPSTRLPFDFPTLIALVGAAVALGTYPIVRRLTKRLERVEHGVRQWGDGDLSLRLPEDGQDEVAALAQGFNSAAARVQALLLSHKALLANASHELRSPLARIRMGLELMGTQPSPEFRDEIQRNIQELDQLIDEILLASRLDASETDMGTEEPVDLAGLSAEECARSGAELTMHEAADGHTVHGVPRLLRRVVRNLLENARRHGRGEVRVDLDARSGQVVLSVSDNGPGVPVELRERIFEPFYRLPGASERDGGVGLGLALVKSIVTRHGGSVRCEQAEGGGARFVVALPRLVNRASASQA